MADPAFYSRFMLSRLDRGAGGYAWRVIHGPRQYGKTTLARAVGDEADYACSLDDDVLRSIGPS